MKNYLEKAHLFLNTCINEQKSFDYRRRWIHRVAFGRWAHRERIPGTRPWTEQSSLAFTAMSFLNVFKYPPSLLYILMTLGPALLFLTLVENKWNLFTKVVSVFGRVPLFYYLLHLYLIHAGAEIAALLTGFNWTDKTIWMNANPQLKGFGFSLGATYLIWIGVILLLYPLCKWYDKYKSMHKEKWWLSYLWPESKVLFYDKFIPSTSTIMKQTSISAAIASVILLPASCATVSRTSNSSANIQKVRTYWEEVWNKGNLQGVADFYHLMQNTAMIYYWRILKRCAITAGSHSWFQCDYYWHICYRR